MPQGPPFGPLLFLIYIFLNRSFIFRCFSKLVFQTFFKNHGHKIDNCSQPSDHSFIKLIFEGVKKDSIIHICYVFIKISPLNREHSSIFLLSKYQIQFWFLKFDSWNIHNLFSLNVFLFENACIFEGTLPQASSIFKIPRCISR